MMKRFKVTIHGRVQGVGFRYFIQRAATQYQISGYVKNLSNGTVEIDAEGEQEKMDLFLSECRSGPRLSNVSSFQTTKMEPLNYTSFSVK